MNRLKFGLGLSLVLSVSAILPVQAQASEVTTIGYVVFDRKHDAIAEARHGDMRFRSASIVKLLIAMDYLWERGPNYEVDPADVAMMAAMLRESNDKAASELWVRNGWEKIVIRMRDRLNLRQTEPPVKVGMWGYTAISPSDAAKIYRYLLDKAPEKMRDYIMTQLRLSTKCAGDGWTQRFGIPSAVKQPWAVKQGWSGFGEPTPAQRCVPDRPSTLDYIPGPLSALAEKGDDIDLTSRAMHTTGTVGSDDRFIVTVFTLQPKTRSWEEADRVITTATRDALRLSP